MMFDSMSAARLLSAHLGQGKPTLDRPRKVEIQPPPPGKRKDRRKAMTRAERMAEREAKEATKQANLEQHEARRQVRARSREELARDIERLQRLASGLMPDEYEFGTDNEGVADRAQAEAMARLHAPGVVVARRGGRVQ